MADRLELYRGLRDQYKTEINNLTQTLFGSEKTVERLKAELAAAREAVDHTTRKRADQQTQLTHVTSMVYDMEDRQREAARIAEDQAIATRRANDV